MRYVCRRSTSAPLDPRERVRVRGVVKGAVIVGVGGTTTGCGEVTGGGTTGSGVGRVTTCAVVNVLSEERAVLFDASVERTR